MAFNADDIEYGPKTLDDFLRGDNPIQRAINFYRYVQMKKFSLCLSVIKATLSMALYGYAMIWFVELRDVWRKLDLEDHESREGWFVWLYIINAFFFIVTLYRFIRAISRLHGAPYEKHTFLDVGEAFDPFIPGRTNVYIYFIFSSAAVIAHVSSSIGIALWVKDWMAGGPATTNPHQDIIVGCIYFTLLMGHLVKTLTCCTVHIRYGARWDKAPGRDPRSLVPDDVDDHLLPLYGLDEFHHPHGGHSHEFYSAHEAHHHGHHLHNNYAHGIYSTHDVHHHEYKDIDIWEGIPRGRTRSFSVSSDLSVGTADTWMTIQSSNMYATWRWVGMLKIHLTDPSLYLF